MSATSSRPSISTWASRSPPAIWRIHPDSVWMRRSSTRPTKSQAMSRAPTMLSALMPSSRVRPVNMARVEALLASCTLSLAAFTKTSTSATRSRAMSPFWTSSTCCSARMVSSWTFRSKPLRFPAPSSSSRSMRETISSLTGDSSMADRLPSMRPTADSNRSRSGSTEAAVSSMLNTLERICMAALPLASRSAKWR